MSYVMPVWPPDSPRVPRGWSFNSSHLAFKAGRPSLVQPAKSQWTEALEKIRFLSKNEFIYKISGSSDATPNNEFTNLESVFTIFSFYTHKAKIIKNANTIVNQKIR